MLIRVPASDHTLRFDVPACQGARVGDIRLSQSLVALSRCSPETARDRTASLTTSGNHVWTCVCVCVCGGGDGVNKGFCPVAEVRKGNQSHRKCNSKSNLAHWGPGQMCYSNGTTGPKPARNRDKRCRERLLLPEKGLGHVRTPEGNAETLKPSAVSLSLWLLASLSGYIGCSLTHSLTIASKMLRQKQIMKQKRYGSISQSLRKGR